MKTFKKLTLALFLLTSLTSFSQKAIKEGVISMKITMSSPNDQINASLAMMGDMTTTTYFKGNKSYTYLKNPMSGESSTIIDNDKKEMLMLLDNPMLGKKYKKSAIDNPEEDLKNIDISETGDFKTILGYKCKGYNVVVKKDGKESKLTMYTTDKITAPNQQNLAISKKIKGYPLYMSIEVKQGDIPINTVMEATEIKDEKIDDSKFNLTIPEGYTEMKNSGF